MWHVLGTYVAPKLVDFGYVYLKKYVKNKVDEQVLARVKERIDKNLDDLVKEINKRTIIYLALSVLGLVLIYLKWYFEVPRPLLIITLLIMLSATSYILYTSVKALKKSIYFIENFDENMKEILEKEWKEARDQSIKSQIVVWLSDKKYKDIENLVISYTVRSFTHWFKDNKRMLWIRVIAYTVVLVLFENILGEVVRVY